MFKTAQVQVPAVAPTPSVIDIIQASLGVSPEDAAVIADSLLPVISYDGAPGMIGTQQVSQKQVVDSMPARSTADQVLGTIQEQPAAAVPVIDPVPIDPVEAARTEAAPVVAETQAPTTVSPADIIPVSGPVQAETPTLVVSGIRTALNSATQLLQPSALTAGLSLLAQPAVEQPEALAPAPGVPAVITTQSPRVTNPRLISQTSCPGVLGKIKICCHNHSTQRLNTYRMYIFMYPCFILLHKTKYSDTSYSCFSSRWL